jgi:hypothetical protein
MKKYMKKKSSGKIISFNKYFCFLQGKQMIFEGVGYLTNN